MRIITSDRVPVTRFMERTNVRNQMIVAIFSNSDYPEALIELEPGEYVSLESARSSLNSTIRRMNKDCLYGTRIRDDGDGNRNLYIIRKL